SALVGNWVASPGSGEAPVAIGVVSVASRKPPPRDMPLPTPPANSGYLGIGLEAAVKKARQALVNKEKDHKAAEEERVAAEKTAKEKPTKESEKALADVM